MPHPKPWRLPYQYWSPHNRIQPATKFGKSTLPMQNPQQGDACLILHWSHTRHTIALHFLWKVRKWLHHSPHYPLKKSSGFSSSGFSSHAMHGIFLMWLYPTNNTTLHYPPNKKFHVFILYHLLKKILDMLKRHTCLYVTLLTNFDCSVSHWWAVLKAKQHYAAVWCSEPHCKPKRIRIRPQFKCFIH